MAELAEKKCQACEGAQSKGLNEEDISNYSNELGETWKIINDHHLEKEFLFDDFQKGLDFTNKVGKIAEEEKHHPDIHLSFGKVRIAIWTHKINGLSESDFILAAKIDKL